MTLNASPHFFSRFVFHFTGFLGVIASSLCAAVPPPEKILPEDTLLVLTAPDFAKVREIYKSNPQSQLWNDPALKSFRENFLAKLKEEVTGPLERELDIRLDDYTSLPQGQVTFALIQNGWQGRDNESLGKLLLIDAKEKSAQLKSNLAALRRKWVDSGKSLRTEKIRDLEFLVLPLSSNEVPKAIRQFLPQKPEVQELGDDNQPVKKPASKSELVVGQAGSLLILADSTKAAEKVAARINGGSLPSLADLAAFQGSQSSQFRDAPLYGWVNVKTFFEIISRTAEEKKDSEAAPNPFSMKPEKLFAAMGVAGLRNLSFAARQSADGLSIQLFVSAPESSRAGLFKIIAGEPKESSIPPFVPSDAVKFRRWRLDGQKLWASLEKMLAELSPQAINTLNFLLDMANEKAKENDPGFDVRKNLIGNLGDDMITYDKAARGSSPEEIQSAPSIFLLGSPNPEHFVAAVRSILGFGAAQAGAPSEREFLGRKIFSAPLPNFPIPGASSPRPGKPPTLHYAATSGYVAMTTDASLLEEYLRSSESQAKRLRETPGLVEASQKVLGPGTGLFGFENQAETMRASFDALRSNSSATNSISSLGTLEAAFGSPEKSIKDLMDFSLLPPYERISKYFHFYVYGLSATSEGLTLKMFAPVSPAMKGSAR